MIERLPTPLLTFLSLHEQAQLGFNVPEQLQLLSEINMKTSELKIPHNTIQVNYDGVPKVYYLMTLNYIPFQMPPSGASPSYRPSIEGPGDQKKIYILKNFGDFKYLNEFVK